MRGEKESHVTKLRGRGKTRCFDMFHDILTESENGK